MDKNAEGKEKQLHKFSDFHGWNCLDSSFLSL